MCFIIPRFNGFNNSFLCNIMVSSLFLVFSCAFTITQCSITVFTVPCCWLYIFYFIYCKITRFKLNRLTIYLYSSVVTKYTYINDFSAFTSMITTYNGCILALVFWFKFLCWCFFWLFIIIESFLSIWIC